MSFDDFKQKFASLTQSEGKIEMALECMRHLLSDSENLRMQEFWEVKNLCVEVFKSSMNMSRRKALWTDYVALIDEARQVKVILDDRASFAIEQIDLALEQIAKDLEGTHPYPVELIFPQHFASASRCQFLQGEIFFLHNTGFRLNALRGEAIHTEMRFKHRNRLLKEIGRLGDVIFPRKKELIKELSDIFLKEVKQFAESRMCSKEDIMLCQNLQKELAINPSTFKQIRICLTEAWRMDMKPKVAQAALPSERVSFDLEGQIKTLLELADAGRDVKEEMRTLRGRVKERLEQYRREVGSSNLNFEKAINMQLLMESARANLQLIEARL